MIAVVGMGLYSTHSKTRVLLVLSRVLLVLFEYTKIFSIEWVKLTINIYAKYTNDIYFLLPTSMSYGLCISCGMHNKSKNLKHISFLFHYK